MKIAIDVFPLTNKSHSVRGTGFYLRNLKESLVKYNPENSYTFFQDRKEVKNADIVHYPYFETFFLTLPLLPTRTTVVTVHDLTPIVFPHDFPSGVLGKMRWYLQRNSLRCVSAIITDSYASKKDIIKFTSVPEDRVHVVYLAAGEEFTVLNMSTKKQTELRKKYNVPDRFALYVGDVTKNKNLPRLVDAVLQTGIPLVMIGKAIVEKNYDRDNYWNKDLVIIQDKIRENSNIIPLGYVETPDLVALYNMATVFVMPSLYEGFGLPILEAMSCGVPVVTSKKGSLQEITNNATFYVDPYDTKNIANGISYVFKDKELQKHLRQLGLEQAKKFSWKLTAEATTKVYQEVIKKKS